MNTEFLKELGLTDDIISAITEEMQSALEAEYERGLTDGTASLNEFKTQQAIDEALKDFGAKNPNLLKKLIDLSLISIEEGKISGLDEQIEAIKKENPFLFDEEVQSPKFTRQPKSTDRITKASFDKMSYMERVKLYSKNPALYKKLKG